MAKVTIVKSKKRLKEDITSAVSTLGGFSMFIKKGDRVLLKPNFNSDDPFPASSDPLFVEAVIDLVHEAGAKEVAIGESSGPFWKPTSRVLEKMGMAKVASGKGVKILDFDNLKHVYMKCPTQARYLKGAWMPASLESFDKIIYIPCMKTHVNARFTLSLKLAMGFPKTTDRIKMHMSNLEKKIAELNLLVKPNLVIMDGRKCFVTGGPAAGKVEAPGVILASADQVALDIEAVKILQKFSAKNRLCMPPEELPLIKRSIEIGIGIPGTVIKK